MWTHPSRPDRPDERDVATDLLIRSAECSDGPNYWLNPVNGVNYSIAVQITQ